MHPTRPLPPSHAPSVSTLSRPSVSRVAALNARATPPSAASLLSESLTLSAPPPSDSLTLADYTPHAAHYLPLTAWPAALGAAGALSGLSHTISLIAGGLGGGTLGLIVGASIGLFIDKHLGKGLNPYAQALAATGFVVGLVAGGAAGALLVGPAAQIALGVGGALLGTSIAFERAEEVRERAVEAADVRARSGALRLAELFAQVNARDGNGNPGIAANVRAMAQLEDAGWRFSTTQGEFTAHSRQSYEATAVAIPPNGRKKKLFLGLLPAVAYLIGLSEDPGVDNPALLDTVKRYSDQGRQLQGSGEGPPDSPVEAAMQTADAYHLLAKGSVATLVHDDLHVVVRGSDAAGLESAMQVVEQRIAQYDQILAPAFAAHKTAIVQKNRLYDAIVRNLSHRLPFERAAQDVAALLNRDVREGSIPGILEALGNGLASADPDTVESYHGVFMRALALSADDPKSAARTARILSHLDPQDSEFSLRVLTVLEQLAAGPEGRTAEETAAFEVLRRAAAGQPRYEDAGVDFATLAALRDPAVSLAEAARDYETLLSGLAAIDAAEEAAPTYAFIRSGLTHGRFGARTYDQVLEDFFTACASGTDPQQARLALLRDTSEGDTSVRREDGVVIIGGIPVPVKRHGATEDVSSP